MSMTEDTGLQYCVDLEEGHVTFDCGWVAPITDMYDEDGDYTLDLEEARAITVKVPNAFFNIYLENLEWPETFH